MQVTAKNCTLATGKRYPDTFYFQSVRSQTVEGLKNPAKNRRSMHGHHSWDQVTFFEPAVNLCPKAGEKEEE